LPDDIALPMFGGRPFNSFLIKIHYNNPLLISGLFDSSGLRFFYSLELREHQAALLQLGDPFLELSGEPIGEGLFKCLFTCAHSCLALALQSKPVKVLLESLCMHKMGVHDQ
jgi:hypothetical protein